MKTKIFIIGFNKTATRSLDLFFRKNKLTTVHWARGDLVASFERNLALGNKILSGRFEKLQVFSDMTNHLTSQEAMHYYKHLDRDYPNSKFILNIRDTESWIKSRLNHVDKKGNFTYLKAQLRFYGLPNNPHGINVLKNIYTKMHQRHHTDVFEYFNSRPKDLLVFDINNDDIQKIINFLKDVYSLDPIHYKHCGKTNE